MIFINGHWEIVKDLHSISKIIREHYNPELADEIEQFIPQYTNEEYEALEDDFLEAQHEIDILEYENSNLEDRINELVDMIDNLQAEINELIGKLKAEF